MRAEPTGLDRGLLTAIAALRWAALGWVAVVLVVTRDSLDRPWLAAALVSGAGVFTLAATVLLRRAPALLLRWPAVALELVVAVSLLIGDRHVFSGDHSQSLGSAWPLASVLSAGVVFGPIGGVVCGVALGLAGSAGTGDASVLSQVSGGVLFALAGGVAGFAAQRLRVAEQQVATARAREDVARTLHDGVLQTLAVVQRRSTDPQLVRLAHEQERDLREWLFGSPAVRVTGAGGDLGTALRAVAARFEDHNPSMRANVVVADDVPKLRARLVDALAGAVGEALTNAAKHGGATRVTVFAEPDERDGVFCSVKDDGVGFDAALAPEGVGITSSIKSRMTEVGGRAEVDGNPGRGTEVRLWVG